MKVSIIVPVYNAEKTIERCVKSIFKNNHKNIEVILIDDYSTDFSKSKCDKLAKEYFNVKVFQTKGKGVSDARNTGLEAATGEIIGFCDADDYFESRAIDEVLKVFSDNYDVGIVVGRINIIDFEGRKEVKMFKKAGQITLTKLMKGVLNDDRIMGSVCNKFFNSRFIGKMRFASDLSYCEDTHFIMKVLSECSGYKYYIIDKICYNYVQHKNNTTRSLRQMFNENQDLEYIIALERIREDCILPQGIDGQVCYAEVRIAIDTIVNFMPQKKGRTKLKKIIVSNIFYFLLNILSRHEFKRNIKRSLYIMREILQIK